jgi:hypothetical protein
VVGHEDNDIEAEGVFSWVDWVVVYFTEGDVGIES